ncbi:hypothetical protein O7626_40610 [Micromonospora sp. WMMD1102]|uniref:hypothetical protein n=1 Tax=Micromonospora sp. WMMD1102 TaxID=3016105 RepID=UPI0024153190|nr:hypothetical protein [Micromonospora sp. WMMD1102]MDG4792120.1 hypothetical protein [Micromonospora sp. WMMD1102]
MTDYSRAVRVLVVVNWRRGTVHGITCDQEQSQRWVRELIDRYGDPLAATQTVDLVFPADLPVPSIPEETPNG